MAQLPLDEVYAISIWLTTLLLAFQTSIFVLYICIFRRRHIPGSRIPNIQKAMFCIATLMLVLAVIHNATIFYRFIFALWGNTLGMSPIDFLNDSSTPSNHVKSVIWFVQIVIADTFLTYRCWMIYGKRTWIIVSFLLADLATLCLGILLEVQYAGIVISPQSRPQSRFHQFRQSELEDNTVPWELALLVLTSLVNLILTGAIATKIWRQQRETNQFLLVKRRSPYSRTLWLIFQSGLIMALTHVIVTILGALHSQGFLIVVHATVPLIGIVFTGIIVGVQLHTPHNDAANIDIPSLPTFVAGIPSSREARSDEDVRSIEIALETSSPTSSTICSEPVRDRRPEDLASSKEILHLGCQTWDV